jgi:hypothetical protein
MPIHSLAWIAPGSQSIPAFPNEAILGINCRRDRRLDDMHQPVCASVSPGIQDSMHSRNTVFMNTGWYRGGRRRPGWRATDQSSGAGGSYDTRAPGRLLDLGMGPMVGLGLVSRRDMWSNFPRPTPTDESYVFFQSHQFSSSASAQNMVHKKMRRQIDIEMY